MVMPYTRCAGQTLWTPRCGDQTSVRLQVMCPCEIPYECTLQSGRSPKVVALFSATNFSSYIIEFLQLQDAIQIQ